MLDFNKALNAANAVNDVMEASQKMVQDTAKTILDIAAPVTDALPTTEQLMDGAVVAGKYGWNLVTSDEAWGESIGVDDGKTPRPFGYGRHGATLIEGKVGEETTRDSNNPYNSQNPGTMTQSLAAKLRVFGQASLETLSAAIGVETEIGHRSMNTVEGEVSGPSIPRFDVDVRGTVQDTITKWTQDILQRQSPSGIEMRFHGSDPNGQLYTRVDTDERFLGLRGRVFGEAGLLGGTVGLDAFLGMGLNTSSTTGNVGTSEYWRTDAEQFDIGARVTGMIHSDVLGMEAFIRGQVGIDARMTNAEHFNLWGDLGFQHSNQAFFFAGAVAEAGMKMGVTGASIGAEAFVGVKAGVSKQLGLTWDGWQFGHIYGDIQARAGLGVIAKAEVDADGTWYNPMTWHLDGNVEAGAVVGIGGSAKVGFGFLGKDVYDKGIDTNKPTNKPDTSTPASEE